MMDHTQLDYCTVPNLPVVPFSRCFCMARKDAFGPVFLFPSKVVKPVHLHASAPNCLLLTNVSMSFPMLGSCFRILETRGGTFLFIRLSLAISLAVFCFTILLIIALCFLIISRHFSDLKSFTSIHHFLNLLNLSFPLHIPFQ